MPIERAIDHEELLAQMGWVQSLARSLVRDPNVAQDVAQEAWIVALSRPPRATSGPGLRAWLASVTRTLARQSVRSERRRTAREHKAASVESTSPTVDVVARGEMHRAVVDRVMALDEPYRSTVLMRYLDDLSAPQIAERQGVTPAAVRKRLSRGLEQMRTAFDVEHDGNRQAWMSALAPLAALPGNEGGAVSLWGHGKVVVALAVAALVTVVVVLWPDAAPTDAGPAPDGFAGGVQPDDATAESLALPTSTAGATEPLAADGPAAVAGPDATPAVAWAPRHRRVRARVVDVSGHPVEGLRMRYEPRRGTNDTGAVTVTDVSDAGGRFEFKTTDFAGRILAASSQWVTLFGGNATWMTGWDEQVIVVASRQPLAGRVIDPAGVRLAGVDVHVGLPEGLRAQINGLGETTSPWAYGVTTGADGVFELPEAPRVPGATLDVAATGFRAEQLPVPEHSDRSMIVTLEPIPVTLAGQVVDAGGRAVPDAIVSRGTEVARTDGQGRFRFYKTLESLRSDLGTGGDKGEGSTAADETLGRRLVAVRSGFLPAVLDADVDPVSGEPVWPADLQLVLNGQALNSSGRVVDTDGVPLAGISVWLADPGVLAWPARRAGGPPSTENTSGWPGNRQPPVTIESVLSDRAEVRAGAPQGAWLPVSTDGDGRFQLDGLMDRTYRVMLMNPWTLAHREVELAAGRHDVEVVFDAPVWPRVRGRVVSRFGAPVEGVMVQPRFDAFTLKGTTWVETPDSAYTVTDAEGVFVLESIPQGGVYFRLTGAHVSPTDHGRDGLSSPEGLVVVVPLRVDVQVILVHETDADRAVFLDDLGQAVPVSLLRFGQRQVWDHAPLVAGRSEVVALSDAATWLVLMRGADEIRREPLHLLPSEVNVLR